MGDGPSRIQLCAPLVVRLNGLDVTGALRGAQGRIVFAYLVLNRTRQVRREELAQVLWGPAPPPEPAVAIRAIISRLRTTLDATGAATLPTGDHARLHLRADIRVDVETALQAAHDAQSAVARGDDVRAWIASHIALNVSSRTFLEGDECSWIDERRAALLEVRLRALEAMAACSLRLAGTELDTAIRASRELVRLAPFRETGHALLIRALATQGNPAEALLVYNQLRTLLRDELGVSPAPELRDLHAELLRGA
jgi:DNA-binding SARP family transcriptional activator